MKLIHKSTQEVVKVGDRIPDGDNGEYVTVVSWRKPHKPSSSGFVVTADDISQRESYVQCYDLEWIEREDQGWVNPEAKLAQIRQIVMTIRGYPVDHLSNRALVENIRKLTMGVLALHPAEYASILKKWLDSQEKENGKL